MEAVRDLLDRECGAHWNLVELQQAGSTRRYYRAEDKQESFIIAQYQELDADWSDFILMSSLLCGKNILHANILKTFESDKIMFLKDLGGNDFKKDASVKNWERAVKGLQFWQNSLLERPEWMSRVFDLEHLLWESSYFSAFLETIEHHVSIEKWNKEKEALALSVLEHPQCVCHRDCQAENLMLLEDEVAWIDFQGARWGSVYYDWASLYYDPYTDVCEKFPLPKDLNQKPAFFEAAMQRLMQAIGAYIKLGLKDGKKQYLAYLPIAIKRLKHVLKKSERQMPQLLTILSILEKLNFDKKA